MADRTSAGIYALQFEKLLKEAPEVRNRMAHQLWDEIQMYDFHPCQMDVNEVLIQLGLAKVLSPADEDEIVYLQSDGSFE